MMSPLCIRILLHYSWSPEDYHETEEDAHAHSPAVAEALDFFLETGLLKSRFGDRSWSVYHAPFIDVYQGKEIEKPVFSITDKGRDDGRSPLRCSNSEPRIMPAMGD